MLTSQFYRDVTCLLYVDITVLLWCWCASYGYHTSLLCVVCCLWISHNYSDVVYYLWMSLCYRDVVCGGCRRLTGMLFAVCGVLHMVFQWWHCWQNTTVLQWCCSLLEDITMFFLWCCLWTWHGLSVTLLLDFVLAWSLYACLMWCVNPQWLLRAKHRVNEACYWGRRGGGRGGGVQGLVNVSPCRIDIFSLEHFLLLNSSLCLELRFFLFFVFFGFCWFVQAMYISVKCLIELIFFVCFFFFASVDSYEQCTYL